MSSFLDLFSIFEVDIEFFFQGVSLIGDLFGLTVFFEADFWSWDLGMEAFEWVFWKCSWLTETDENKLSVGGLKTSDSTWEMNAFE